MSLLVENGGHQSGPTNRDHRGFGCHNWRPRLSDIHGGVAIEYTRSVSLVVGMPKAKDGAHKTKLAEEYNHLSTGKD